MKRFLIHLLQQISGPVVLVSDQYPIHRRTSVQEFIDAHPRLHVFEFPTRTPELNPAEIVWTQMTEYAAGTVPQDTTELYDLCTPRSLEHAALGIVSGLVSMGLYCPGRDHH